ncbi:hypothetical protein MMPV_001478 [Pyropia vietnamensis]
MVDVDDVYALHAAKSLVAVGWVHTLPAITAAAAEPTGGVVSPPVVLSGEQVHTQAAFQVALPEAVAVVVSPTRPAGGGAGGGTPLAGGEGASGRSAPRATAVRLGGEAAVAAVRACSERGAHEHPPVLVDGVSPLIVSASHVVLRSDGRPSFKLYDLRPLSAARVAAAAATATTGGAGAPPATTAAAAAAGAATAGRPPRA